MKKTELMVLGFFVSTPFFIVLAEQWYLRIFGIFFGWVFSMFIIELNTENQKLKKRLKK